jgi:cellulose synthase/poly-beta-1,6-N-acetylglucosamine synthase-like glycosyltransferase
MLLVPLVCALIYLLMQTGLVWGWKRIPTKARGRTLPPISVVIAAYNEAENLRRYLPTILNQAYPAFEVVLVLDRCTDGSRAVAEALAQPNLRLVEVASLPDGWAGKKYALQQGISAARYEHLAFTDADCEGGPAWLGEIAAHFYPGKKWVLGLGLYRQRPGWLNRFVRYETFYAAFQYIGFARWGMPYMGVGRNLAYRKSSFQRVQGFEAIRGRLSGDDDLLVNAHAQGRETAVMVSPDSRTYSQAKPTFRAWLRQKFRHVSAATAYSYHSLLLLGLFHLCHLGFYLSSILLPLINLSTVGPVLALYIGKTTLSWLLMRSVAKIWQEDVGLRYFPVLDFLFFLYNFLVVPIGLIRKPAWI